MSYWQCPEFDSGDPRKSRCMDCTHARPHGPCRSDEKRKTYPDCPACGEYGRKAPGILDNMKPPKPPVEPPKPSEPGGRGAQLMQCRDHNTCPLAGTCVVARPHSGCTGCDRPACAGPGEHNPVCVPVEPPKPPVGLIRAGTLGWKETLDSLGYPDPYPVEPPKPPEADPAVACLDDARRIVTGARRGAYGNPEDNFARIASLWNAYLEHRALPLTTVDVALLCVLIKVARLIETPGHADSWVDLAGYAACGTRCAKKGTT